MENQHWIGFLCAWKLQGNFCSRTCPEWIQTDQTLGLLFCRSSSGSVADLFQKQPVKARCLHGIIWKTTQEWFQIVSCNQKQIRSVLVWNDSSLVPCEHSLNCFGDKAPYEYIHSIPKFNQQCCNKIHWLLCGCKIL